MNKLPVFRFTPILKQTLWGGDAIVPFKRLRCQMSCVGESWEISALKGSETLVAEGDFAGRTLAELLPELGASLVGADNYARFGNNFPLLVKFIDAKQDLSIQVHPNDEMAQQQGYPFGKNELWYIIATRPEAKLYVGLNRPLTPESYTESVANDTIFSHLCSYSVAAGDCFYLPPGRIHSIGAGCLLAEIQQSCDITYRIYDFKRKDKDGNYRELHTELAAQAIDFTVLDDYQTHYTLHDNESAPLVNTSHFSTAVYHLGEPMRLDYSELDSFVILMAVEGKATLCADDDYPISFRAGETLLIPATTQKVTVRPDGAVKFLETYI